MKPNDSIGDEPARSTEPGSGQQDAIILGCVSGKFAGPARAKDLHDSALFTRRRRYAEASGRPWVIFSAKHGILDPDEVIECYDVALSHLPIHERRAKGEQAVVQLEQHFGSLHGKTFEIHAGASYVKAILAPLRERGARLINPLDGLQLGYQLQWYDRHAGGVPAAPGPAALERAAAPNPTSPEPAGASAGARTSPEPFIDPTDLSVTTVQELAAFDFRWPEGVEHFDHGWEFTGTAGGTTFRIRHGIGGRQVYGRFRVHSVTWVERQPMVEGVAADDYAESGALLSLIRIAGREHVREYTDLPLGYAGFTIVRPSDEIVAKYSPQSLAVKVLEDDLSGWARHAILRAQSKARARAPVRTYGAGRSPTRAPPRTLPLPPDLDESAIVRSLLTYGAAATTETNAAGDPFFTENPAANRFVIDNPFAFLLAVIFDQGIRAERAWAAPYELQRRLGHLDPARIADEPERVAAAIQQPPTLQRFINTVPGWVVAASRRVLTQYGGDAGAIWGDQPTADELERRFDEFQSIGQKKSAMAVEILERDLKVKIRDLHRTEIAYDVHVRRVFLRTGLADRDDRDHMIDAARRLHPSRPGAIDMPMWLIGRRYCRPGVPLCSECPLFNVCPRLVDRAAGVRGA